jgi:Zn-dependent M28 family amino/carboxypeptidase
VADGCGAVDNWTGVVALAHLYRSLKDVPLKKTVLFVAFGKEERGLVGSRAMADAIGKDRVAQYCEMINIDSLGLAAPQAADNVSSKRVVAFTADLAKGMKIPFSHASIEGADADSSPFLGKKIPAITLHGLNNDWPSILHSRSDQTSRINPVSVYLGYRLVLALVVRLDGSACGEYR